MAALERERASVFGIEEARTLAELEAMSDDEREGCVIPVERVFEELDKVTLAPFFARLARCGVEIYLKKIGLDLPIGKTVRLADSEGFFALGEVREFEAGLAIKPIKQFA